MKFVYELGVDPKYRHVYIEKDDGTREPVIHFHLKYQPTDGAEADIKSWPRAPERSKSLKLFKSGEMSLTPPPIPDASIKDKALDFARRVARIQTSSCPEDRDIEEEICEAAAESGLYAALSDAEMESCMDRGQCRCIACDSYHIPEMCNNWHPDLFKRAQEDQSGS